jgi:hypothetical protein
VFEKGTAPASHPHPPHKKKAPLLLKWNVYIFKEKRKYLEGQIILSKYSEKKEGKESLLNFLHLFLCFSLHPPVA